ncbi:hypothetical protein LPJ61_002656 [Coemansia biformis]|uniref:Uncharacterized protein n=1 Tax=Coemansia biformis TaxID=1286918 RepID=A0A9W7YEC8_9FUNG|nr:hypothetical protein LPJ61_002656 [Coemansia biformis]
MDTDMDCSKYARLDGTKPRPPSIALHLPVAAVQCAYPELKREALSELFDHCMTPLASPRAQCSEPGTRPLRARPLSAAPTLGMDFARGVLGASPAAATGMVSPTSPAAGSEPDLGPPCPLDNGYFVQGCCSAGGIDCCGADGCGDGDGDGDGGSDCGQAPARGTFADLRRRLYGGDLHAVAAVDRA